MAESARTIAQTDDLQETVDLLQYQVNLLGHMLSRLSGYLDLDFEQLLLEAEHEMNKPDLRLVKS